MTASKHRVKHGVDDRDPSVSRRHAMSAVGTFGGMLGLARLTIACTQQAEAGVGTSAEALTGTNWLDFVADCGADPTGVADCGPAIALAGQKLAALATDPRMAANSAVLNVPPGAYRVRTSPGLWNLQGSVSNVLIRGQKDASVFICDQCAGSVFNIGNGSVTFEHLTFVGTDSHLQGIPDCTSVIELGFVDIGTIRECKFIYLWAGGSDLGVIYTNYSTVRIFDSQFLGVAGDFAVVLAGGGTVALSLFRSRFIDYGSLNAFTFNPGVSAKMNRSGWVRLDGCSTVECRVEIVGCYMDEAVLNHIRVDAGSVKAGVVRVVDTFINLPGEAESYSVMQFAGVRTLELDGIRTNVASANPAIPALILSNVDFARVRNWMQHPSAAARFLVADETNKYLRVEQSDFGPADIRSRAQTTELQVASQSAVVECVFGESKCDMDIGDVLKISNNAGTLSYSPMDPADSPALAVGVAIDSVVAGSSVRIARPGQRVAVLSDGTTPIAVGDPVSTRGAAASGQVTAVNPTPGKRIIGIAMTAASAGSPTLVDVFFRPGQI